MKQTLIVRLLLSVFVSLIISSNCSFGQSLFKIKAHVAGLGDRPIRIQYSRKGILLADTIEAYQGQFKHSMDSTDGNVATLVISPSAQLTFWLEPGVVSISGSLNSVNELKCTGTPENDVLELYRNAIEKPFSVRKRGKSTAEADPIGLQEQRAARQFIKQHPSSLTAAYLLYWQTTYDTTIFDQLDQLLKELSPSVKTSYWAQKATTRIYNFRNRPRVGKKLPSFSQPDATGKLLSLDSFKGKYILIDFWGTWCVPCIQTIPELKVVHTKYKDRLAVISIALERPTDRDKWLRAIDKYGMTWPQTAQFSDPKEGVNGLYNVIEYPTLLLADPDGVLLARIKYGEPIDEKIQQFLNK